MGVTFSDLALGRTCLTEQSEDCHRLVWIVCGLRSVFVGRMHIEALRQLYCEFIAGRHCNDMTQSA